MGKLMSSKFDLVKERVNDAKAIAWDNCHKIYVLMDMKQVINFSDYDTLVTKDDATPEQMFALLKEWYDDSCSLKFIEAVSTNKENEQFETLIGQFEEDEDL